jgi:hypothetical protein
LEVVKYCGKNGNFRRNFYTGSGIYGYGTYPMALNEKL